MGATYKFVFIFFLCILFSCANVSIRNYKPSEIKETERTIVGSFEAWNSTVLLPECKLTFLLPNGKDLRRYFSQKEDQGLVVTWSETGIVQLKGVDCGDGSYRMDLTSKNLVFNVSKDHPITYFGHLIVKGTFSGMSNTAAGMFGAIGAAVASSSQKNELQSVKIEDRSKDFSKRLGEVVPQLKGVPIQKELASENKYRESRNSVGEKKTK